MGKEIRVSPGLACFRVSVVPLVPGQPEKWRMYASVIITRVKRLGQGRSESCHLCI